MATETRKRPRIVPALVAGAAVVAALALCVPIPMTVQMSVACASAQAGGCAESAQTQWIPIYRFLLPGP